MRFGLWWLALVPLACGKSTSRSNATDRTGTGGGALAGVGGDAGTGGDAGRSESGGRSAGGASSVAGSSGSAVGGSAGIGATGGGGSGGGASGTAGDASAGDASAGEAGAAGAPDLGCRGRYSVCGCGCCGGEPMSTACYYPERGDDLAAIIAEDQMAAMSPSCATTGCSIGVHLVCCETEPEAAATYGLVGWSQDTQYLMFSRTGGDGRCSALIIARSGTRVGFPLELPERWRLDETHDGRCDGMMGSPVRDVLGALGVVNQTPLGYCNYDIDFTLFFLADNGEVDPVRFKANGLSPPGLGPGDRCP